MATIRNPPRPPPNVRDENDVAVPLVSAAKVVSIEGFERREVYFGVAGVALCDIQMCVILSKTLL